MRSPLRFAFVALLVLASPPALSRSANASESECPVSEIGHDCGGGNTCVDATCCDDPSGCAFDAGSGSSSGGSSSGSQGGSSGAGGGTGVSRACGVCTFLGIPYCAPADVGKACGDGGTCNGFGGGGDPSLLSLDGGTTSAGFSFTGCGAPDEGDDGGGGSSSGGSSGSSSGGVSSGGSGSSSGGGASSGSSSSGSSGGTGSSGGATSDGGTGNGTVTAGCAVAPITPRGSPWGVAVFAALGLAWEARRSRRVLRGRCETSKR